VSRAVSSSFSSAASRDADARGACTLTCPSVAHTSTLRDARGVGATSMPCVGSSAAMEGGAAAKRWRIAATRSERAAAGAEARDVSTVCRRANILASSPTCARRGANARERPVPCGLACTPARYSTPTSAHAPCRAWADCWCGAAGSAAARRRRRAAQARSPCHVASALRRPLPAAPAVNGPPQPPWRAMAASCVARCVPIRQTRPSHSPRRAAARRILQTALPSFPSCLIARRPASALSSLS
jgi:hypothetical protein